MDFFARNEQVEQMEADLLAATGDDRLPLLLCLGWQMRQRDTKRALLLVDEVESLLAGVDMAEAADAHQSALRQTIVLRLMLIRAEAKLLFADLDAAKTLAESALQGFTDLNDALGCADAHSLLAWTAYDQGDAARNHAEVTAMSHAAAPDNGNDSVRFIVAQTAVALGAAFRDGAAAHDWAEKFASQAVGAHPAALAWIDYFLGTVAGFGGDYVLCIRHLSKTYALALASGQIRLALGAAISVGDAFNNLNEYQAALEWMERGLDLARPSRWPVVAGIAFNSTAETLRRLQRYDAAHRLVGEALAIMAPLPSSRNYAVSLRYLAEVELDRDNYGNALETFQLLEQRALALSQADLLFAAQRGQADALFHLGQPESALRIAQAALDGAKSNADRQIKALRVIADIHARYPLPPPSGVHAGGAPLHYLQQALDLAATITAYNIPDDLFEDVAQEHAKLGHYRQAYRIGKQASLARQKIHNREVTNRAHAMQVNHQTEQVRLDAERHRHVAAAEAERAMMLQKTNETLERLSAIGQEITAHLNADLVFQVLSRHVQHLLDVNSFVIYRMDVDGSSLNSIFGLENGQVLPQHRTLVSNPTSHAACCVRERREILIDQDPALDDLGQNAPSWMQGTELTLSRLFAPLCVADKVIGVMTIQSRNRHAYGPREQLIFRTLCSYGAIALANADSLLALQQAQVQLDKQEKLASLGSLVAGFAHQLNTPIAAIKSSGKSIADAFDYSADNLLKDFSTWDTEIQALFITLMGNRRNNTTTLSTREERTITRMLTRQLQAADIANAEHAAGILMQLQASTILGQIMPLLRHPACDSVLEAAHQFSQIPNNAANINIAANRMANIIFALKSLSGMDQSGEKSAISLSKSVDSALALHQSQIQNKVVVASNYDDIAPLFCLPEQIKQVWINLIHNALQAMDYHGNLMIGIGQDGGNAVVTIKDSGAGIPESIRGRIFEAFFTTKTAGEGSGLGLAIVKMIVERHKGRIEFDSVEGVGSTFTVCLPYE